MSDAKTRFEREQEADELVARFRSTVDLIGRISSSRELYADALNVEERSYIERSAEGLASLLNEYIKHFQPIFRDILFSSAQTIAEFTVP